MHACVRLEGRLQEKRRNEQMHRFIQQSDRREVLGVSLSLSHLPCYWFRPTLSIDRQRFANPEERKKNPSDAMAAAQLLQIFFCFREKKENRK